MATRYEIRRATIGHQELITRLIDEAGEWLRTEKGSSQWNQPWPTPEDRDRRIWNGLIDGRTWIAWDGGTPVASLATETSGNAELWTAAERATAAIYLHRLVLNRAYAGLGLGGRLIDWAGQQGFAENPSVAEIRIDTWTDNHALHEYYERHGFEFVDVRETADNSPSGHLLRKPIGRSLTADISQLQTDDSPALAREAAGVLVGATAALAAPWFQPRNWR